jgi:hypothetical protein
MSSPFDTPGPDLVSGRVGGVVAGAYISASTSLLGNYGIVGGPPGVTFSEGSTNPSVGGKGSLGGIPTVAGIFDATLQHIYNDGTDVLVLEEQAVRFIIGGATASGGLFLEWFHDDPLRRDLQIDVRTSVVSSGSFDLASPGLRLNYRDTQRVHILFRDTGKILDTAPTLMRLIFRPLGQIPGEPWLDALWNTSAHESLGGAARAYFDLTPGSDELDSIFAERSAGLAPDNQILPGTLEIVWQFSGQPLRTSRPVLAYLANDFQQ